MAPSLGPFSLERMVRAVEKVRERLLRATAALEKASIPYAVCGGNAVAVWVTRVDESAVRNTRDVDILIRRSDLDVVKTALLAAGFDYKHTAGLDLFLDGSSARPRDAVHIVFAGEKVRPEELLPNPDVTESVPVGSVSRARSRSSCSDQANRVSRQGSDTPARLDRRGADRWELVPAIPGRAWLRACSH